MNSQHVSPLSSPQQINPHVSDGGQVGKRNQSNNKQDSIKIDASKVELLILKQKCSVYKMQRDELKRCYSIKKKELECLKEKDELIDEQLSVSVINKNFNEKIE